MRSEKRLEVFGGRTLHVEVWRCGKVERARQRLPFSLFDFGTHAQLARGDFGWAASIRLAVLGCGIYLGTYRHPSADVR